MTDQPPLPGELSQRRWRPRSRFVWATRMFSGKPIVHALPRDWNGKTICGLNVPTGEGVLCLPEHLHPAVHRCENCHRENRKRPAQLRLVT